MKITNRFVVFLLILTMLFSLVTVGCKGDSGTVSYPTEPISISATYEPLNGGVGNDTYLFYNPDRGYRSEMLLRFKQTLDGTEEDWRTMAIDDGFETNKAKIERLFSMYLPGSMEYKSKLIMFYIILEGFNKDDIPQEVLDILDYAFELCRIYKVKALFRIGYHLLLLNQALSDVNKQTLSEVCATEDVMLRQIDQLTPFIAKNKDAIHKMSSGFIGYAGEMAYNYQYPHVNYSTVIKAIVEKLCVPNGLQYSTRRPDYKLNLLKEDPDYQYQSLIGFNNDALYGKQTRPGWSSGGLQYGADNGWYDYVTETAAYTSQSGEMYTNNALLDNNKAPLGLEVIQEVAEHRYTTISHWHTLYEAYGKDNVMKRWIENETVTSEWCDANGIIYDPNWFVDSDGNQLSRNPYEFIRDHLGYKLVAEKSAVNGDLGKLGKITVDMSFRNYGFAAAWFLESGFVILNDKYEVISSVKAGEPDTWISLPSDYYTTKRTSSVQNDIITYNISGELTLPEVCGKYYIAFYLKNSMNDYAALSNDIDSVAFEGDGFNILYEIVIE